MKKTTTTNKVSATNKTNTVKTPAINVVIDKLIESGKTKAFASATIGGAFAVHGIRVVESDKGPFVSMPQDSCTNKNGETKYEDRFHPITAEARTTLYDAVIKAYEHKLEEEMGEMEEEDAPREGMEMSM